MEGSRSKGARRASICDVPRGRILTRSKLYCYLKLCNIFCTKRIMKTRYRLSYRQMEWRPREKNQWFNSLALLREWKNQIQDSKPCPSISSASLKIQVSVYVRFESWPSGYETDSGQDSSAHLTKRLFSLSYKYS
jgi:hypothetical protein